MPQVETTDMKKVIDNAAEKAHKAIHKPNSLSDKANPHLVIDLVCTDIARGMYRIALGETEEIEEPEVPVEPDEPTTEPTDPEEPSVDETEGE